MDNETLTSAFTELRQRLTHLAGRMLGREDEAADTVQDAFCRLWLRRGQIESRSEIEGLSVTTVKNLCIDHLRHNAGHNVVSIDENIDTDDADDDPREQEELYKCISAIIDRELTTTQQSIIRMREYEGRDFEEIASTLGMQQAAVRMQLSRARRTVREYYRNIRDNEK